MRRSPALLVAFALGLAACGGGDEVETPGVDLGDAPADDTTTDDTATDDTATDDPAGDDPAGDDTAGDDDGSEGSAGGEVADLREARPGTWPVGDAGTVTFAVTDGRLVLEGHEAADGWEAVVDEEDDDEVEVDFRRDDVRWEFEVELDDGRLEIDLRQDHEDASDGTFDLPDGGSFSFSTDGAALTLEQVDLADGWELTEREEDGEEFEFSARDGDRELEVEVEVDDGRTEVEIDLRVTGPVPS